MNIYRKNFFYLMLALLTVVGAILVCTTATGATVFFSTDWETGTPDACWPCKTSSCTSSFNGWIRGDWNSTFTSCGRSSTLANSGTYSYYQYRASGAAATCDIYQNFKTPEPRTIYLRFYLYLTTNWNSWQSSDYVHLLFTNSARSNTGFRLNFTGDGQYNCGGNKIHMVPEGHGGKAWDWGSTWNTCAIDMKQYIGAWHAFEYKMEISGSNVILTEWIDGVLTRGPITGPGQDSSGVFSSIIISGWENTASPHVFDFYIDDIVVADSYIGPTGQLSPRPPTGFRAVP
jgi:hypothetical protein